MCMKTYDIAIIGAGVIGAMTARELSRYDLSICLIEKENDVARGASGANSGIVHVGFDAVPGTMKARFNTEGSQKMPSLCNELGVSYLKNGSLVLGYSEKDRRVLRLLLERGRANGVTSLSIIEKQTLCDLEPAVSPDTVCALYAPAGGIVNPFELVIAAVGNAMDNGVSLLLNYHVSGIKQESNGFIITDGSSPVFARRVVNAAGIYADSIAKLAGDDSFSLRPRRGEYILLDKDCGNIIRHTLFTAPDESGKGILVTPTTEGNLLLGPTSVFSEDKSGTETTVSGIEQIIAKSKLQAPDIPSGKAITSFAGLRAVGNTGDFIIGSNIPGLIHVAGIESPGLTSAPAIADYIVNLLDESGISLQKKKDFNPVRPPMNSFHKKSPAEKNKQIHINPRYGRIVCRCEQISEGEIIEAMKRNPAARDTDGIKRRVRCGMGRCQGGFCLPSVTELLARELGIPFEVVTKSGQGSEICRERTK